MARITAAAREQFDARFAEYREQAEALISRHEEMNASLGASGAAGAYDRLNLAESLLDLTSLYLLRNRLSELFLRIPDTPSLDGARSSCEKSIIHVEHLVGDSIDLPLSELTARLDAIEDLADEERYRLVRKIGFTIQSVADDHGENSRFRWYFVDLEGRFTVVARNLLNLRTLVAGLDPRVPGYETRLAHLALAKDSLKRSADQFHRKFEGYSNQIADMKRSILFLGALRRIHLVLAEAPQAEAVRRQVEMMTARINDLDGKMN